MRSTRPFVTEEDYHRRATRGESFKLEVLTFSLGDEEYGLDIQRLREIVRVRPITEVPRAPGFVLGIIGVRGEVLPVLDLRRRLRLPAPPAPAPPAARVIIVRREAEAFGLQVDAVRQVVRLREQDIEATPPMLGGADSEFIAGIGRPTLGQERARGERIVILLALDAVLDFRRGATRGRP